MTARGHRSDGRATFHAIGEWPAHPRRLLTAHTIFDANVPISLAEANKTQMLRAAFSGRAHIPGGVRAEISGIARNRIAAAGVLLAPLFAEVHDLDRAGRLAAQDRQIAWKGRTVFEQSDGKVGRGEAECHELASQNKGWVVVSQDADAINHGRIKNVPVYGLADVLIILAATGQCLPDSAFKIYEEMCKPDVRKCQTRYWRLDDDPDTTKQLFLEMVADLIANP
jgi:predicted nucleic acid-binding protein